MMNKPLLRATIQASLLSAAVAGVILFMFREYGLTIFLVNPLASGIYAAMVPRERPSGAWRKIGEALLAAVIYTVVTSLFLLVVAIEGAVCLAMASPFVLGCFLAGFLMKSFLFKPARLLHSTKLFAFVAVNLLCGFAESSLGHEDEMLLVRTSVRIQGTPAEVWDKVITFSRIPEPTEFLFRHGISYPIHATLDGTGVGAVRSCNFNTGSFVEPITAWKDHELLAFDVAEQPLPMRELSIWDVDAPHLDDYFRSHRGQFALRPLGGDSTLLEGTTWYTIRVHPNAYWRLWSDRIIHAIHARVLEHIKRDVEGVPTSVADR